MPRCCGGLRRRSHTHVLVGCRVRHGQQEIRWTHAQGVCCYSYLHGPKYTCPNPLLIPNGPQVELSKRPPAANWNELSRRREERCFFMVFASDAMWTAVASIICSRKMIASMLSLHHSGVFLCITTRCRGSRDDDRRDRRRSPSPRGRGGRSPSPGRRRRSPSPRCFCCS
jgi:hypothetical protein